MAAMAAEPLIIAPNSRPQAAFLASSAHIAVYGGAAGGGKTYGMVMAPLLGLTRPGFGGIIFRRTRPQLFGPGSVWEAASEIYPLLGGRSRTHPSADWRFPSGATMQFASLQHEHDVHEHQSKAYAFIGFEEGTHFTEHQLWYLMSRLRSVSGVTGHMRITCNPDPDHVIRKLIDWWLDADGYPIPERSGVVRWFVRLSDGSLDWADDRETLVSRHPTSLPLSFTFIAAKLEDNVDLVQKDPHYRAKLSNLPRVQQLQLLGGNWNVRSEAGDYFQRSWFEIVDAVPGGVTGTVRFWDKAATSPSDGSPDPDWTRGAKVHRHKDGSLTIEHIEGLRRGPADVLAAMKRLAEQDGKRCKVGFWVDPGQAGIADRNATLKELFGWPTHAIRASRHKEHYASVWSPLAKAQQIRIVRGPWNDAFLAEAEAFPLGRHDDQVDAVSGAVQVLSQSGVHALEAAMAAVHGG
ncbi:MAG: phage terminase large subunit [Myxococcota bacterium]